MRYHQPIVNAENSRDKAQHLQFVLQFTLISKRYCIILCISYFFVTIVDDCLHFNIKF